jgi:5-carboxymethyl-2-hydroxymuconate isomerase
MPHLTLEYTGNIAPQIQARDLFAQLHQILASASGIRIENMKSRAVRRDDYYIGAGTSRAAFVHLEIRFMAGRSSEFKQSIGQQCLTLLKETLGPALAEFDLQITVEIGEIERASYFKFPPGTL